MIDFLRSQTPQSPVKMRAQPISVVDALRQTNTYTYTALPTPPFEPPMSPKSYPSPTAAMHSPRAPETPSPSPKKTKSRSAKRDTLATFFRWTEPTPELRPLLLTPMARAAEPNPSRARVKDDDATRLAAAQSRVVPIGGARAARLRSQRRWGEQLGRGRPALSLDIDSELSYERERVMTPVESVFVARERERDSWLKR
ncbi:hypothetical protein CcaverHIS002_0510300 [Cutaneotrichosporon cavernicola]|nr:hypothetical protein CcaverHIS002_0510300 [Cutaneotrichosporon cavernicola]